MGHGWGCLRRPLTSTPRVVRPVDALAAAIDSAACVSKGQTPPLAQQKKKKAAVLGRREGVCLLPAFWAEGRLAPFLKSRFKIVPSLDVWLASVTAVSSKVPAHRVKTQERSYWVILLADITCVLGDRLKEH